MRTAALLVLVACKTPEPEDSDTGPCTNSIAEVVPASGALSTYYRDPIRVRFATFEDDAQIRLTGPLGGDIPGARSRDGDWLVFTPTEPLRPASTYTVTIDYSCGEPTTTFTTSEVGAPAPWHAMAGRSWAVDLQSGTVVEPAGIGAFLQESIETQVLVFATTSEQATIRLVGALGLDGADPPIQDPCTSTMPMPPMDFTSNPYFDYGPTDTTVAVGPDLVTIEDLHVAGSFSPLADYVVGIELSGTIDTRPLVQYMDCGSDGCAEDFLCELAETFDGSCVPCNDGPERCLQARIVNLTATELDNSGVELHGPDSPQPAPGSVDYCTRDVCAAEEACLPAPD